MAAPVPAARATPDGNKLKDGFSTKITIGLDSDISFWEKTVTPPAVEGGDKIDQTTMHNSAWRTFRPRSLKTLNECTLTAAYDPDVYDEIIAIINAETTITVTFPDGSTLAFFGYLRFFEPSEHTEGEQPECTITIEPTNYSVESSDEEGA